MANKKSSFKKEVKDAIDIAIDLHYSNDVIEKIECARSVEEIDRIMTSARLKEA